MPGGLFGIDIAKSGLFANQRGIDVTGQNIANANNEDYHKQRVVMEATSPLFPLGFPGATLARQIGTGVDVKSIERMRDFFLERRLREENQDLGKYEKGFDFMHQVELIYNEPSENSLRSRADEFWKTLEDLANHPEDMAVRAAVRESALGLTEIIGQQAAEFLKLGGSTLNTSVNQQIGIIVDDLNGAGKELAQLNKQIQVQLAAGHQPNDLMDMRDGIVKKISKEIDVDVSETDPKNFLVTVGGITLAQGVTFSEFETKVKSDGKLGIYVKNTSSELFPADGELKALFDFRDKELPAHINGLADFAATLVEKVNDLHKNGFGLDGSTNVNFFQPFVTQTTGVYKITGTAFVKNPELALNGGLIGTVQVPDINALLNGATNFNSALDGDTATAGVQTAGTLTFNDINNFDLNSDGSTTTDSGDTSTPGFVDYDLATDTLETLVNKINLNVFNSAGAVTRRTGAVAKIVGGKLVVNGVYNMTDTGNLMNKLGMTPEKENFENTDVNSKTYPTGVFRVGRGQLSIDNFKVSYDGNSDTLQDIAKRINDLRIGIIAEVNAQNRLVLRGTAATNFKISELSDSGNLLERLGVLKGSTTFESTFPILDSGTDGSTGGTQYLDAVKNNINRGLVGQGFLSINGIDIFSKTKVDAPGPGLTSNTDAIDNDADGTTDEADEDPTNVATKADAMYDGNSSTPINPTLPGRTLGDGIPAGLTEKTNITLETLRDAINAAATANPTELSGVVATITDDNRLIVTGVTSWRDTGDLTQALRIVPRSRAYMTGDATSESYISGQIGRPPVENFAFSIDVSTDVKNDLRKIAAAGGLDQDVDGVGNQTLGPGNGDNMLRIASLKDARILDGNASTMDQFFGGLISSLGIDVRLAETNKETQLDIINNINLLNKSISGVSLDEEMTNLMKYQRGFQASAKVLSTTDKMIDVLLGMGA